MTIIYDQVRLAIKNKQQVIATYGKHRREMCPHAIGLGPTGNEQALFFQFAGASSKGDVRLLPDEARWRCLALDDLSDVVIQDGDWHSGSNHGTPNTCIRTMDLEVAY